jgi:uncharacterized protein (DUF885 family)
MSDARLDALAKEIFDWSVEWNPVFGTFVGIHTYDHLLPRGTYEAQMEELAKTRMFLGRLEDIERRGLSASKKVDHGVLRNSLRISAFELGELRIWEGMPGAASTVAEALFLPFVREFAPLASRLEGITGRLERAPRYIREARSRIRAPVKIWCEIGKESAERTPGLFQIIQTAGAGVLPPADQTRLDEAAAKATEAVSEYAKWIESDLMPKAKPRVGVGATKFRKLVRLRELGHTVEEIYAIGKRYLAQSRKELVRLAGTIRQGATPAEAKEIVKRDHPERFEDALAYTATAMADSRRFVVEHNLATVPPNEELRVIETPSFARHVIPFAAYYAPAKFDARQQGFYMVTPIEDKPEMLREHAYAFTRNTAVHEGYPGHHLQLTCANLNPSPARILSWAVETIEGWAHYCEDMMKEAGFGADPATRFAQMTDQIWRACRILIDIDLHLGRMTFDEAVDFLTKETGMERPGAVAEVRRYTYTPGYQLSYLLGKHMIVGLRKDVRKRLGRQFSDRFFHDTILYAGSLPMKHIGEIFAYKTRELRALAKRGV